MDNDQKFIGGMVTLLLMVLIVCATLTGYNKLDKWDRAVTNGADPMVTTCALYQDTNLAICTILAQGRK